MTDDRDRFALRKLGKALWNFANWNHESIGQGGASNFVRLPYVQQYKVFPLAPPAGELLYVDYFHGYGPLVEMRSCIGLDALAYSRLGMRPARNA